MVYLVLVFFIVWSVTAYFAWMERKGRMAAEGYIRAVAVATAQHSSALAAQVVDAVNHQVIKEKIAPFVHDLASADGTDMQKHYQTLLVFLKEHPGISVDAAQAAMSDVASELAMKNGDRQ